MAPRENTRCAAVVVAGVRTRRLEWMHDDEEAVALARQNVRLPQLHIKHSFHHSRSSACIYRIDLYAPCNSIYRLYGVAVTLLAFRSCLDISYDARGPLLYETAHVLVPAGSSSSSRPSLHGSPRLQVQTVPHWLSVQGHQVPQALLRVNSHLRYPQRPSTCRFHSVSRTCQTLTLPEASGWRDREGRKSKPAIPCRRLQAQCPSIY